MGEAAALYWRVLVLTWVLTLLGFAIVVACLIWLLFKIRDWSRLSDGAIQHTKQPVRFWIGATASSGILAILVSATGYLLWALISSLSRNLV